MGQNIVIKHRPILKNIFSLKITILAINLFLIDFNATKYWCTFYLVNLLYFVQIKHMNFSYRININNKTEIIKQIYYNNYHIYFNISHPIQIVNINKNHTIPTIMTIKKSLLQFIVSITQCINLIIQNIFLIIICR